MNEDWLRLIAEEKPGDISKNDNGRTIIPRINTIFQQVFYCALVQLTEYCISIGGMVMLL